MNWLFSWVIFKKIQTEIAVPLFWKVDHAFEAQSCACHLLTTTWMPHGHFKAVSGFSGWLSIRLSFSKDDFWETVSQASDDPISSYGSVLTVQHVLNFILRNLRGILLLLSQGLCANCLTSRYDNEPSIYRVSPKVWIRSIRNINLCGIQTIWTHHEVFILPNKVTERSAYCFR